TPDGNGYWLVASDGGVFGYGNATFFGSTGSLVLKRSIVAMAATPGGNGYWLLASDGGVFAYGNAPFEGSATDRLGTGDRAAAIVGSPSGKGYAILGVPAGIRVGFT